MMAADDSPDEPTTVEQVLEAALWRLLLMTPGQPKPEQWLEGVERYSAYYRAFVAPGITADQQELMRSAMGLVSSQMLESNELFRATAESVVKLQHFVNEQQEQIRELRESLRSLRDSRGG